MQRTMKRIGALALALALLVTFMPVLGLEENAHAGTAEGIVVLMTVSDEGVIAAANDGTAMAWKEVFVTDRDGDGKYTYDEALVAAHELYNKKDGYATGTYGVSKLWGKETTNTLFFVNGEGIPAGVTVDTVEDGDFLEASINADSAYFADWFTSFDGAIVKAGEGKDVELTLKGHLGMAYTEEEKKDVPLSGIQVGTWENGVFVPIEGAVTDEEGKVKVSFNEPGDHVVTAKGTVKGEATEYDADWNPIGTKEIDCPTIAPACIVTIPGPIEVHVTVNNKGVLAKDKDGSAMADKDVTVEDLNKDGEITVDEALQCAHEQYYEDGADGYGTIITQYGIGVSKLWGVESQFSNFLFFVNGEGLSFGVGYDVVEDGDDLYASVNNDDAGSDYYSSFDRLYKYAVRNEKIKLTLEGHMGMAWTPEDQEDKPLEGVQIGTWSSEGFVPIEGIKTGADGTATISFEEEGEYLVTAKGTVKGEVEDWQTGEKSEVDCTVMAPFCYVYVEANPAEEASLPVQEEIDALPEFDDLTLDDKDAVWKADSDFKKLSDEAAEYITDEQYNKLALCLVTIDKLQAQADLAAAQAELATANAELEKAKSDLDKAKKDAEAAETEATKAKEDLENANAEIEVLKKQVQKVKAKAGKKKATVSWKSLGSGYKYEVYTATKLNGKFKKAKTVSKAKATIKKLKSKKTYYVKVRGFKTVNGNKVYTQFSETVSVKAK